MGCLNKTQMSRYCLQHKRLTNCLTVHWIGNVRTDTVYVISVYSKRKTQISENLNFCEVLGCCGIKLVLLFYRENDVLRAENQYLKNIISSMVCLDYFLHMQYFFVYSFKTVI